MEIFHFFLLLHTCICCHAPVSMVTVLSSGTKYYFDLIFSLIYKFKYEFFYFVRQNVMGDEAKVYLPYMSLSHTYTCVKMKCHE